MAWPKSTHHGWPHHRGHRKNWQPKPPKPPKPAHKTRPALSIGVKAHTRHTVGGAVHLTTRGAAQHHAQRVRGAVRVHHAVRRQHMLARRRR